MQTSTTRTLEQVTLRKVYLRLVPYCFVLYILCYIDRINVSFAALTMNSDLGLTALFTVWRRGRSSGDTACSRSHPTSSWRRWARESGSLAS
jgi:hypothetical protein